MRNSVAAPPGGRHLLVGRKDKTYEKFMAKEEMLVEQGRPCRQVLLSNGGGCADSGLRTREHFSGVAVKEAGRLWSLLALPVAQLQGVQYNPEQTCVVAMGCRGVRLVGKSLRHEVLVCGLGVARQNSLTRGSVVVQRATAL